MDKAISACLKLLSLKAALQHRLKTFLPDEMDSVDDDDAMCCTDQ